MSAEMDTLKAAVAANDTVETSAVTLLQGLAVQIADAAGDRAASVALSQDVQAQAAALSAAITANTPTPPAAAARR
jgi:hypothetical protein